MWVKGSLVDTLLYCGLFAIPRLPPFEPLEIQGMRVRAYDWVIVLLVTQYKQCRIAGLVSGNLSPRPWAQNTFEALDFLSHASSNLHSMLYVHT